MKFGPSIARPAWWPGMLLGAALAIGGMAVIDGARFLRQRPPASTAALQRPMAPVPVEPSWIKSGTPNFRLLETARSPDGRVISGVWACDGPTTFEWTFDGDETVHLLEGRVDVEYQGRRFTLLPGQEAVFHTGTRAVWHVPSHVKKAYTLHKPGRLVQAWRWLQAQVE